MGGVGHRRRAAHLAKAQQRAERAQVPGVGVAGGAGAITGSAAPAKPRTGPRGCRQPKPKASVCSLALPLGAQSGEGGGAGRGRLMGGRKVTLAGSKAERNSMGSGECVSSGLQMQGSRRRRAGWK